jgi:hypothetical protein
VVLGWVNEDLEGERHGGAEAAVHLCESDRCGAQGIAYCTLFCRSLGPHHWYTVRLLSLSMMRCSTTQHTRQPHAAAQRHLRHQPLAHTSRPLLSNRAAAAAAAGDAAAAAQPDAARLEALRDVTVVSAAEGFETPLLQLLQVGATDCCEATDRPSGILAAGQQCLWPPVT